MKVADLTAEELRDLIGEVVGEKLRELFFDPDSGLELREEIQERLNASLASEERIPLNEVKRRLGLNDI